MSAFSVFRAISGMAALPLLFVASAAVHADPSPPPQRTPLLTTAKLQASPASRGIKDNAVPAIAVETFSAPMPAETIAGFRMGGAPQLEFVFGDIDIFKRQLDAFEALHQQMKAERVAFAEATHAAQQALAKAPPRGMRATCPAQAVATNYAKASTAGLAFQRLGGAFETSYFAIRQLDQLGESSGLTPDYRWQVKKSGSHYRQALTDLKEMRIVFQSELEAGLRSRGCKAQELLALAQSIEATEPALVSEAADPPASAVDQVRASTATFFVDNASCSDSLEVHVDGTLLGKVAPGKKTAFQSLMGRHSLCLLGESGKLSCGETGTLRNAFVYDGFSVSRHCEQTQK